MNTKDINRPTGCLEKPWELHIQGSKWSPLKTSNSIDTIGKECLDEEITNKQISETRLLVVTFELITINHM